MSKFKLENDCITAFVEEHASEIHSLKRKDKDIEYIWQGDEAYWGFRNPTLFPLVGNTWVKILHIKGKEYTTGNHGFCRTVDFTCVEHDDTHIVMELKDSEDTLKQYPFHFVLRNIYKIEGDSLSVTTTIENTNDEVMPFNFGYHPAFNVPLDPSKDWSDAKIIFDQTEIVDGNEQKELELNKERLGKTVILANPNSSTYTLSDGSCSVIITAPGFPWCAFWSKLSSPFVCIEPWHSHTDFTKVEVPFEQREGTIMLEPHQTFQTGYTITVK